MSDVEDNSGPIRKTRSGRAVKTPAKPKSPSKPASRKLRKKLVVMEVEVSEDEELEQIEPAEKKTRVRKISQATRTSEEDAAETEMIKRDENIAQINPESPQLVINDLALLGEPADPPEEEEKAPQSPVRNQDTPEPQPDLKTLEPAAESPVRQQKTPPPPSMGDQTSLPIGGDETATGDENGVELHQDETAGEPSGQEAQPVQEEDVVQVEKVRNDSDTSELDTLLEDEQDEKMDIDEEPKEAAVRQNGDPEAENISDEELPGVPVVKVPETEEVSDEELPGPKRAELPADTEVVSEDELPATKKDQEEEELASPPKKDAKRKLSETGYDPTSPTSENEAPPKKLKEEKDDKDKEGADAKPAKPKKLPELDKYWKAVNDDPTDFTGWTCLLQYVDQESDMEAAREAYDAFLSHYPYCYGYWRKYADYEKRKGNKKKCEEVFERGLKAIPLSVDLWIHYIAYVKATKGEDEEYVRSQFERALAACGLEFRSDRLWDSYIKWETDGKRLNKVTGIFDRLLVTPTQGYTTHFDNFQEHVSANNPSKILDMDEFMALRKEVRALLKSEEKAADNADLPPGDEDSKLYTTEEETKCIKERIVSIRRKIHKNTVNAVTARWNFEEGIKRPYFHVKPLERCQLKNWQDYLDFEIEQGDRTRIIVLFERCLIACALYEEFWAKFVHYLEGIKDKELQPKIRDVYERACTIHHLKKPNLHLQWAIFEETVGNINRAAEILVNLEKQVPNVLQVAYRRINLERRRQDFEKCGQLFEHYITNSKNKMISSNIAIKYSRFCLRILKDFEKAQEILKLAISKDANNPRLYLQLVDLTLQKENIKEEEVCEVIDEFLEKDSADADQKALFAQRKLEYLEDFGTAIQSVQAAYDQYQKFQKLSKEAAKKKESKSDAASTSSSKKEKTPQSSSSQAQAYGNYNYGTSSTPAAYNYSGSQQGQYNYQQYSQAGDQYQYQNWQYPQGGAYGSYNQWGGYTGGYGY
uniref:Pre-mRNA-processing factor 39 n=1 Tax=Dendroctonus ponderosae TaxID=77166 RepID=A0AAR5QFG4_DENPD